MTPPFETRMPGTLSSSRLQSHEEGEPESLNQSQWERLSESSPNISSEPTVITSGSALNWGQTTTYSIHGFAGEGKCGRVYKCTRADSYCGYAIKIMKNYANFPQQAKKEVAILKTLRSVDPDRLYFVHLNEIFFNLGNLWMELELLDMDFSDYMRLRAYRPLPLKEIRAVVCQLASALQQLKTIGIIHGDLKLENIMVVDHKQNPLWVKIIDFGMSCHVSVAKNCTVIQSLEYRCPEVMLGFPFSFPADMWSLGCFAAFIFLGTFLYSGKNEYELMRCIVETQGNPPDWLLEAGMKTDFFFCKSSSYFGPLFVLKPEAEYCRETESRLEREIRFKSLNTLKQFKHPVYDTSAVEDREDQENFVDMLKAMLELEASRRISPRQILELPFFTMPGTSSFSTRNPCNRTQGPAEDRAEVVAKKERDDHILSEIFQIDVTVDDREHWQRNSKAGVATHPTQTDLTAVRSVPTAGESRISTPTKPETARSLTRMPSPRSHHCYNKFLAKARRPPDTQSSIQHCLAEGGKIQSSLSNVPGSWSDQAGTGEGGRAISVLSRRRNRRPIFCPLMTEWVAIVPPHLPIMVAPPLIHCGQHVIGQPANGRDANQRSHRCGCHISWAASPHYYHPLMCAQPCWLPQLAPWVGVLIGCCPLIGPMPYSTISTRSSFSRNTDLFASRTQTQREARVGREKTTSQ